MLCFSKGIYCRKDAFCVTDFMKRSTIIIICAALLCVVLFIVILYFTVFRARPEGSAGHSSTGSTSDPTGAVIPDDPEETVNYQLNEFDRALIEYLFLNGYDSSDFIISPTSFRTILCVAAAGAQGNTRTELVRAAGFSGIESVNTWYSILRKTEVNFSVSNSVWNNRDFLGEFTNSYISNVRDKYDAEAYSFRSDDLTQAINDWIDRKTDGSVPTIADDLAGASSVLISTLQLKTAWKNAFITDPAHEELMEQTGEFLYAEEYGTQVVAIPLEGNLSFVCFRGNRIDIFDKMRNLHTENVHVVLPKFELESAFDSSDLLGFLLNRGVHEAIDGKIANFYNMCQGTDWFVQEIIQKSKIQIDKEGIVTAKAHIDSKVNENEEHDNVKEFIADSPFSFAIFSDFGSGNQHMLFYGQIMNGNE